MEWTAVGCSDWSARNPVNLYSFVASNVGDRAVEWRIIDFHFVKQQPKPCRPYAEKVKSPDRVVIQGFRASPSCFFIWCLDFTVLTSLYGKAGTKFPKLN